MKSSKTVVVVMIMKMVVRIMMLQRTEVVLTLFILTDFSDYEIENLRILYTFFQKQITEEESSAKTAL